MKIEYIKPIKTFKTIINKVLILCVYIFIIIILIWELKNIYNNTYHLLKLNVCIKKKKKTFALSLIFYFLDVYAYKL